MFTSTETKEISMPSSSEIKMLRSKDFAQKITAPRPCVFCNQLTDVGVLAKGVMVRVKGKRLEFWSHAKRCPARAA